MNPSSPRSRATNASFLVTLAIIAQLVCVYSNAAGQQLLNNPGFESGLASWTSGWYPAAAGPTQAVAVAARTGSSGLKLFTADTNLASYAYAYQGISAAAGNIYQGSAYIQTASAGAWATGATAQVVVTFLDASGNQLSVAAASVTVANTPYGNPVVVTTSPAPAGTATVQFACTLSQPANLTTAAQSVAYFDDCSLTQSAAGPQLNLQNPTVGFGDDLPTSTTTAVQNAGTGSLTWSIQSDSAWLSVSPSSGVTPASGTTPLTITVNRTGLVPGTSSIGHLAVTSNGGTQNVAVYLETAPSYTVPAAPSIVTVQGTQLIVQKRLPDGTLSAAVPYTVKGVDWSPAVPGTTTSDNTSRRAAFVSCYRQDLQMLRAMNANTISVYLDFGASDTAAINQSLAILDYCYKNGIMVIMTVDEGDDNSANIPSVVAAFQNHPAIMAWALGNEWDLLSSTNTYYGSFTTLPSAAAAIQQNASQIKNAANTWYDANHPVASVLGDDPANVSNIMGWCPSVDLWGENIYRGEQFGTLFTEWASNSKKPMYVSEYGVDAFYTTNAQSPITGFEDQADQATWESAQWQQIAANLSAQNNSNVCVGGSVFEFVDEWWKVNNDSFQSTGGFNAFTYQAQPDSFSNEAWYGLVDAQRIPRQSYYSAQQSYLVSSDSQLMALVPSAGVLTPAFSPNQSTYTMTVGSGTGTITLTPTAVDPNSTITINGTSVTSGDASASFTLTPGSGNTFEVEIVSEDKTSSITYTVQVTQATPVPVNPSLLVLAFSSVVLAVRWRRRTG